MFFAVLFPPFPVLIQLVCIFFTFPRYEGDKSILNQDDNPLKLIGVA